MCFQFFIFIVLFLSALFISLVPPVGRPKSNPRRVDLFPTYLRSGPALTADNIRRLADVAVSDLVTVRSKIIDNPNDPPELDLQLKSAIIPEKISSDVISEINSLSRVMSSKQLDLNPVLSEQHVESDDSNSSVAAVASTPKSKGRAGKKSLRGSFKRKSDILPPPAPSNKISNVGSPSGISTSLANVENSIIDNNMEVDVVPSVRMSNRFSVLAAFQSANPILVNKAPSTSRTDSTLDPSKVRGALPRIVNTENVNHKITVKPPPLYISNFNYSIAKFERELAESFGKTVKIKYLGHKIRLQFDKIDSFKQFQSALREKSIPFFTFTLNSEKALSMVLKGLPDRWMIL